MSSYRTVVVGGGSISVRHIKGWKNHPDANLIAIADINGDVAKNRAEEFEIPNFYTDYQKMLQVEQPDLVSICTWMITHLEIGLAASEAGVKGILCEKPFAGNLEEIDQLLTSANKNGTRIALGHHNRFLPSTVEARRLISKGAIGTPVFFHREFTGGLFNNGSHAVDTVRYLLEDPKPVWALGQVTRNTDRHERHEPIEDFCGGIIALEGGQRIILESDLPDPTTPKGNSEKHTASIYGTDGTLILTRSNLRLLNGKTNAWEVISFKEEDVGTAQAVELINWIEGRVKTHRNSAVNNRTTIEILIGLYESARTRNLVRFPLQSGPSPLHQMIEDGTLSVKYPGKYDIRV